MVTLVDLDATWVNPGTVSYDAAELRGADAAIYSHAGIVRETDLSLDVTVDASDNVTVQPGPVVIPGNAVTGGGVYRTALAAIAGGVLAARDATNPRIDLVVFRQLDTDVVGSHGAYTARLEIIEGTPSATPGPEALPSMAVEVGRITVPASGAGPASVDLTHRTYACAVGGALAVPTAARLPATAPQWQRAVALDTGVRHHFDGTDWLSAVQAGTIYPSANSPVGSDGSDKKVTSFTSAAAGSTANITDQANSRFVILETGWHDVAAQVTWATNVTGIRYLRIRKNGNTTLVDDRRNASTTTNTINQAARPMYLVAGDVIELYVWQNSSASVDVVSGAQLSWFTVARRAA